MNYNQEIIDRISRKEYTVIVNSFEGTQEKDKTLLHFLEYIYPKSLFSGTMDNYIFYNGALIATRPNGKDLIEFLYNRTHKIFTLAEIIELEEIEEC